MGVRRLPAVLCDMCINEHRSQRWKMAHHSYHLKVKRGGLVHCSIHLAMCRLDIEPIGKDLYSISVKQHHTITMEMEDLD